MSEKELKLTLTVPETDFDGIELQMALRWVRKMRQQQQLPPNPDWDDIGRYAEKILSVVADKYNDAVGEQLIS